MRLLRGGIAIIVAWLVLSATARASTNDYVSIEHCVGASGANPVFSRWVGAVDASPQSAITVSSNPVQLEVDLKSGFRRTATGDRHVTVSRLRRNVSTGALTAEVVPTAPKMTLMLTTEVDPLRKSVATSTVDSYLFEFESADDVQSCVLTFADVWQWASDTLADGSPLQMADGMFYPGQVSTKPLEDIFTVVAPHQLWAAALTSDAPIPRSKIGHDPLWTSIVWDGATEAYRVLGSPLAYTFWICASGPSPNEREMCLPLLHERVADLPVVVRSEAEATLTQEIPLKELAQTHVLTTAALVATKASHVTRTILYNGDVAEIDSPAMKTFVTSERTVEYSPGVFGSADVEHEAWRCPQDVDAPPRRVAVFIGAEPQRWDVVACLYEHTPDSPKWRLVAAPIPGTPEREAADSFLFALCAPGRLGACMAGEDTGIEGQQGFHLTDRTTKLSIQVRNTDHPSLVLDLPSKLGVIDIVSPPRLPDAAVLQTQIAHIDLDSYTRAEWEAEKIGACIESVKAWKDLGVSDDSDGAATLMLRAGDVSAPLGNGRWELEATTDGRELLCPHLTGEQIDGALTLIRDALVNGQTAGLTMIQGGRLVGHVVTITGPSHPVLTGARLMVGDGGALRAFARHAALPQARALYVLTTQDWGERIVLDPSKIALDDDHGRRLLSFESRHGPMALQTFTRKGALMAPWLYAASIVDAAAPAGTDGLVMRRAASPSADAAYGKWVDTESPGCERGCGEPVPPKTTDASFLARALTQFHTGLAWGHVFSLEHVPPTELRAFVAAPLAMEEYEPVAGKLTLSAEAGPMVGLSFASGVVNETFMSRTALPLGGYAAGCVSATLWHDVLHSSPQLCLGAAIDLLTPKLTATAAHPAPELGVEAFGLTPYVSVGLGQF